MLLKAGQRLSLLCLLSLVGCGWARAVAGAGPQCSPVSRADGVVCSPTACPFPDGLIAVALFPVCLPVMASGSSIYQCHLGDREQAEAWAAIQREQDEAGANSSPAYGEPQASNNWDPILACRKGIFKDAEEYANLACDRSDKACWLAAYNRAVKEGAYDCANLLRMRSR